MGGSLRQQRWGSLQSGRDCSWDCSWALKAGLHQIRKKGKERLLSQSKQPMKMSFNSFTVRWPLKQRKLLKNYKIYTHTHTHSFPSSPKLAQLPNAYKVLIQEGQSQRTLEHRDISQGAVGQVADCIRGHQDTILTTGHCRYSGTKPWKTGRVAFVLQSQAGNLCSKADPELELCILWIKPRIKGRMQDLTNKIFKARTQRSHRNRSRSGAGPIKKKTQIEAGIVEGRVYRKWKSVKKDRKTLGLSLIFFFFFASLWNSRKVKINMAL